MRKKDLAKIKIGENIDLFSCPICEDSMYLHKNSLFCSNNHCFDLSKNGYINLLRNSVQSKYDKKLFVARNIIIKSGIFNKFLKRLSEIILENINEDKAKIRILDAGCGEGSHIAKTINYLNEKSLVELIGVGLDISKQGIYIAAREYPGIIWCVGDLTNTPFMANQFDILLNILSPANYNEFNRVLNDKGLIVKVVPGSKYLQKLRNLFYKQKDKKSYSNEQVIDLFQDNFNIILSEQILYKQKINQQNIKYLLRMTPLSWGITKEKLHEIANIGIYRITIDLNIIIGTKEERYNY